MSFSIEMKRVLGIDFGDVRVGVAVSDELGFLAHPLETIDVRHTPAVGRIRNGAFPSVNLSFPASPVLVVDTQIT